MTDFTDEQIESLRRHAAEVVMDCYRGADIKTTLEYYYFSDCTIGRIAVVDWRPDENANQAVMLLEKCEGVAIINLTEKWATIIGDSWANAEASTFPLAALVAVCRATGWQE